MGKVMEKQDVPMERRGGAEIPLHPWGSHSRAGRCPKEDVTPWDRLLVAEMWTHGERRSYWSRFAGRMSEPEETLSGAACS